jgi:tetratricopeptide (TPR) repeat protein
MRKTPSASIHSGTDNKDLSHQVALHHLQEGDKYAGLHSVVRISSWPWKLHPDWEMAVENYIKATKFLKIAKAQPSERREAHLKVARTYEKLQASFEAADQYQIAASLVKDDCGLDFYEKAADLYAESGQLLMTAKCYTQAGNVVRDLSHALFFASKDADSLHRALTYYQQAIDIYKSQEKYSGASKIYDLIVDQLLVYQRFDEALAVTETQIRLLIERELRGGLSRIFLRQIIIYLSQRRIKVARDLHLQYLDFNFYEESPESTAAHEILKASEFQNQHQLQHCLQYPCVHRLQNSVKDLSLQVGS